MDFESRLKQLEGQFRQHQHTGTDGQKVRPDQLELSLPLSLSTVQVTPGTNGDRTNCYITGSKFVIQYNDGGTIRYKYLELTGTSTTWTHTTTAP